MPLCHGSGRFLLTFWSFSPLGQGQHHVRVTSLALLEFAHVRTKFSKNWLEAVFGFFVRHRSLCPGLLGYKNLNIQLRRNFIDHTEDVLNLNELGNRRNNQQTNFGIHVPKNDLDDHANYDGQTHKEEIVVPGRVNAVRYV